MMEIFLSIGTVFFFAACLAITGTALYVLIRILIFVANRLVEDAKKETDSET